MKLAVDGSDIVGRSLNGRILFEASVHLFHLFHHLSWIHYTNEPLLEWSVLLYVILDCPSIAFGMSTDYAKMFTLEGDRDVVGLLSHIVLACFKIAWLIEKSCADVASIIGLATHHFV